MPAAAALRLRHRNTGGKTRSRNHTSLPPIRSEDSIHYGAAGTGGSTLRPGGAGRRRMRSAQHVPRPDQLEKQRLRQEREEAAAAARRAARVAGASPLMYACQQGRDVHVRTLLQEKPERALTRDRTMKSALHYCAENATVASAELVLAAAPELLDARDEDGFTALHLAVIAGNVPLVRFLLHRNADLGALDNESHSVVHWATVCGEVEALEALLRAGAAASSPDIHGGYPIHYAAQMCGVNSEMGNDPQAGMEVLRTLLSHGVDVHVKDQDSRQPILWAASAGSADAVLALVNAGANVEADDKDGLTALHCAASRGHTECLETLVTLCGAEVNVIDSNGCTALFYAVTLGHADCTQMLLNYGAESNRQDRKGRTAAHCGAAKGQLETLKLLGAAGANLWTRNVRGDLPLHDAVQSGRRELVRWLLAQRPDAITAGNNDGRTSLHIAALNNNVEMCKVAIDAQSLVNPVMRGVKGQLMTPLDAALLRGNRGCAKYLQLHGGVPSSKLTEETAAIRGPQRSVSESQMAGLASSVTPATMELLTPRETNDLGMLSATPSPRASSTHLLQVPPSDQMTQTHQEMFNEQPALDATSGTTERRSVESHKSHRRSRSKKSPQPPASSSDSEAASEAASSTSRRRRSSRRPARAKRKTSERQHSGGSDEERVSPQILHESPSSSSPQKDSTSVIAEIHTTDSMTEIVTETKTIDNKKRKSSSKHGRRRRRKSTDSSSKKSTDIKKTTKITDSKSEIKILESNKCEEQDEIKDMNSVYSTTILVENQSKLCESSITDGAAVGTNESDRHVSDEPKLSGSDGKSSEVLKQQASEGSQKDASSNEGSETTVIASVAKTGSETTVIASVDKTGSETTVIASVDKTGSEASVDKTGIETTVIANVDKTGSETTVIANVDRTGSESTVIASVDKADEKMTDKHKRIQEKLDSVEAALEKHNVDHVGKETNVSETKDDQVICDESIGDATKTKDSKNDTCTNIHEENGTEIISKVADTIEKTEEEEKVQTKSKEISNIENEQSTLVEKEEIVVTNEEMEPKEDSLQTHNLVETQNEFKEESTQEKEETNYDIAEMKSVIDEREKTDKCDAIVTEDTVHKASNNKMKDNDANDSESNHIKHELLHDKGLIKIVDDIPETEEPPRVKRTRRKTEKIEKEKHSTSNSERDENNKVTKVPSTMRVKPLLRAPRSKSKDNGTKTDSIKQKKNIRNKELKVAKISSEEETSHSLRSTQSSIEEVSECSIRSKAADSGVMLVDSMSESPQLPRHRVRKATEQQQADLRGAKQSERRLQLRPTRNELVDDSRKGRGVIGHRHQQQVVSVTQAVQVSTRKYQLERRIFQELLELKRLQIRAGRSNEHVLVKRAVDEYRRAGLIVGLRQYDGPYNFQDFENYLYEQLRLLQKSSDARMVPRLKPSDDVESLSAALRRTLPGMPGAVHHAAAFCTLSTHRCRHATEAYTGIPVAAYVNRASPVPPRTADGFLPRIEASPSHLSPAIPRSANRALQHVDPSRPVTLELSHGGERQVIALPTERLDRTKRYYVTFTIKPGDGQTATMAASAATGSANQQHRHAKSL